MAALRPRAWAAAQSSIRLAAVDDRAYTDRNPMPRAGARVAARLRAPLWMIAAAASFAVMINLVRFLSQHHHVFEIVFFRNLFGLAVMLPWLWRQGTRALATRRLPLHLLRAALGLTAMVLWFWTLSLLPLAEATALSFTAPVFASLLAILFLGEPSSPRRWTAMALAFAGALVILRPGARVVDPAALLALATALVWGTSTILVKLLGRTEPSAVIVTWMVLLLTPLSALLALPVWRFPTATEFAGLVLLGALGSLGHFCMSQALKLADAGFVAPFDYLRLPFVAFVAWLAFEEPVSPWTWVGGLLIAAGSLHAAREGSSARGG